MNLHFGILLQKKDLYSVHCIKIPDEDLLLTICISRSIYLMNFYDTSTALREQIYYKPIYYNCIVTMDGQYHFSIISINS